MKAIGIKLVELIPMIAKDAKEKGYKVNDYFDEAEGYEVIYQDGYKSWTPKLVADRNYFKLNENNDGTIIMKEDVKNFIKYTEADTVMRKTTIMTAKTVTDFELVTTSSCISPKNYSLEIGSKNCMDKVVDSIWNYLGFILQWARNGISK